MQFDKQALQVRLKEYYDSSKERHDIADKYNLWLRMLHHQWTKVHEHKWNNLSSTVGLPRTGKSIFTAWTCWLMNDNFDMKRDVIFNVKNFSQRLDEISKIGETIINDEAGVSMPAREFWKIQNREISKMLQTAGYKRPIVFFVAPDFTYIDSQPRKIFHYFYECVNRTNDYVKVKPFQLSVNRKNGKLFFKYPRIATRFGLVRMRSILHWMPPIDFVKEYERISNPEKDIIHSHSRKEMSNADNKDKFSIKNIQGFIVANPKLFLGANERFDSKKIQGFFADHFQSVTNPENQSIQLAFQCDRLFAKEQFVSEMKRAKETGMLKTDAKVETAINKVFKKWESDEDDGRIKGASTGEAG